ncbi:MAG: FAD-binding oxidoreductase [Chloroflexota bacterium]
MVVEQVALDGGFDAPSVRRLEERLVGKLIRPGDTDYEATRMVWNAAVDRRPALIVRCGDPVDVIQAVRFAREHNLPLAIRSGGHSMAGHGVVDGGVVIDLSRMNRMTVDPERRIAWTQPGLTWGEYTSRAHAYGLATPAGDSASVGVGGLTLGGGIGWLVRKHGLSIDNLVSVEMVTADGRLVTASETEHPDLFWALRGGGGNFGVATGFEFRLHPVSTILGGAIFYPAESEVLQAYARAAAEAPDEVSAIAAVMQAPAGPFIPAEKHGSLVFAILVCYAGDLDAGQRAVAPLRALGTPIAEALGPMPYPALFDLTKEGSISRPHSVRSGFLDALDAETATTIMEHARRMTSPLGMVQLRVLGGAMARVPAAATAFAHRDKPIMLTVINGWTDPAETERHVAWTDAAWRALRPRTTGVYVNFLQDEGAARILEAYRPAAYQRLAEVKRRYDPGNLFQGNQNIRPAP